MDYFDKKNRLYINNMYQTLGTIIKSVVNTNFNNANHEFCFMLQTFKSIFSYIKQHSTNKSFDTHNFKVSE